MKLLQDLSIGETIKKLRLEHNMTQVQVVAKLQVLGSALSETGYSKLEGGYRNLFISDLLRLKEIFGVEFNAFFADTQLVQPEHTPKIEDK